ncbi:hypothetical protein WN51_14304 [Melipona quadrifasciata]|uniref:Uncharacterized protein n=1 Tax=Melipona quadrifasciata TaxID=166423 RepID=A0A0M9A1A9_9HYME|nr:hypothetical protein WN51_14304 [Melipona quadrifasciata]
MAALSPKQETNNALDLPQEQTTGPVAAVSSGRGQQRGYDRGQATIERRRETSPRQPLQEGRLHNQGSESKILRWSPEYQASVFVIHYYLPTRRHRKQQRQRGAVHRTDEVPPTKRNPSSPTSDGDAGSNGAKLDLITDLPTNLSDCELPINIDTHKTSRDVEEKEEEAEIKDETAKAGVEATHGIHDTVKPTDTNDFLRGGHTRDPENLDDSNDQRNASSSSHGIDLTDFVGGSTPPILELGVVRKSSESSTPRDDPSALSASRTPDDHVSGMIANTAGDLTSSSLTAPSAAHQSHYRGVADQFEGRLSWNVSPENPGHMATVSPKQ